jgi:hypothetical protein
MKAKILFVIIVLSTGTGLMTSGFASNEATMYNDRKEIAGKNSDKSDSAASAKAFLQVYKVLMSPRCMNCHPAGDIPLQGDDSHLHTMSPKRGKDGHGLYAMKCANCHQPANTPGAHTPPGNPKWGLPPLDMKMVFQGKTARQLALQIRDYNQNGHKNRQQLLEHARDTLIKAGWNMGEGRPAPPLTYTAFLKVWDEWINKGLYAPSK